MHHTGTVIARFGNQVEIATDTENQLCSLRRKVADIVTGDTIIWEKTSQKQKNEEQTEGVVTKILPRQSCLVRFDIQGKKQNIAANVDQMIIVIACEPNYDTLNIDHYLIGAELSTIAPIILLNKVDLDSHPSQEPLKAILQVYQDLGYQILYTSSKLKTGLDKLKTALNNKTSILVGQSGVGKSSLVKQLLPKEEIRTQKLSDATRLGKHTTSVTRRYPLSCGGFLIDSPGIRQYSIGTITQQELSQAYPEIKKRMHECKFRDCQHTNEPQCAVKGAVIKGEIVSWRYENYKKLLSNINH